MKKNTRDNLIALCLVPFMPIIVPVLFLLIIIFTLTCKDPDKTFGDWFEGK